MPNYTVKDVSDYFKNLAVQHPMLRHQDVSKLRTYEVRDFEKAFGDLRALETGYFVRFILPTLRVASDGDNAQKVYQTGLLFARNVKRREGDGEIIALGEAEAVADNFLSRMVLDSRNGHPLFSSSADTVDELKATGTYVTDEGDGTYVAFIYLFDLSIFNCLQASASDAGWLDGGLTEF